MSLLLSCDRLSKSFGPRLLFREISISFDDTERTGLIGPNGSGKSTLLKILAGVEQPDDGSITTRRQLRVGYLPQHDLFEPGQTVHEAIAAAATSEHLDVHEAEVEASILLGKVGFSDFDQKVETLSGGWRKRLAIARALIQKPDLLLLDEPTNHLDLEGILWLEELLTASRFSFLLVTHDRYFLENVSNRVVELSRAYADGYLSATGPYSDFLVKREEHLDAQARNAQALASKVRREVEWLRRGAKARTTKAKGRIEQAGQMMQELAELRTRNAAANTEATGIDFISSQRQTRKLLSAKHVAKTLGDKQLFKDLDLVLSPGTKLGLLGPNGSGKSTLIKLLAGHVKPDAGTITRAENLRVVLFEQDRRTLDKSQTLRQALSPNGDQVIYRGDALHVTTWAKQFLFRVDQLDLPVSELSGGEQARVLIAKMMLEPADVLILDEPTNDLDIPTLEVLEESLSDFPGALVLVTHDRHLLDRVSTVILALDGQGNTGFYADVAQWQSAREARQEEEAAQKKAAAAPAQRLVSAAPPAKVKLSWKEQRELEGMEAAILSAEEEARAAQGATEDRVVLADHVKSRAAFDRLAAAQDRVKTLYARWEELEGKR
jgi:ATP-binding cassette subfamily F protein uup